MKKGLKQGVESRVPSLSSQESQPGRKILVREKKTVDHNRGKTLTPGMATARRVAECDVILLPRTETGDVVHQEKIEGIEKNSRLLLTIGSA